MFSFVSYLIIILFNLNVPLSLMFLVIYHFVSFSFLFLLLCFTFIFILDHFPFIGPKSIKAHWAFSFDSKQAQICPTRVQITSPSRRPSNDAQDQACWPVLSYVQGERHHLHASCMQAPHEFVFIK